MTSYWDAKKTKDRETAARLSASRCLLTGAQGVMSIAKSKMAQMTVEGSWTLESYKFDDVEVTMPTPDVAIIAYTVTQKVTIDGKSQELRAADTSTWVRGADGWECHGHSEKILKDGSAAE